MFCTVLTINIDYLIKIVDGLVFVTDTDFLYEVGTDK